MQLPRRAELVFAGLSLRAVGRSAGCSGLLIQPDGGGPAVLWAPRAGRLDDVLLHDLAGIELAVALLGPSEEDDPADPVGDPGEQPSLVDCALALAQLRAAGSVTDRTSCLLVGVGHRQGRPERLTGYLAHWGAEIAPDGTWLQLPPASQPAPTPALGGRTLVLGGSASGKSDLAEHLLAARSEVLYAATGPAVDLRSGSDPDWGRRVSRHRERRPAWWQTEETDQVAALLMKAEQPVLLDSVGTWLTGVLDRAGAWQDRDGWRAELAAESDALLRAWRSRRAPLVAVSDEVGQGVVPATAAGRLFRNELGRLNQGLAQESERVLVVTAGRLTHGRQ
jgi:adenosylcobinamide kinase/adenosylcobinamide-phosphate guanylyltransferase